MTRTVPPSFVEIGPKLKGSSTKNFLSPKSHILDSNGVWYSSFWSEGPKNHRNLKILVSNFVPRGLRRGEVPSDYQGPRGTAPNDKSLKSFISGAAPRNPMAPPLETPGAPRLKTPGDKI